MAGPEHSAADARMEPAIGASDLGYCSLELGSARGGPPPSEIWDAADQQLDAMARLASKASPPRRLSPARAADVGPAVARGEDPLHLDLASKALLPRRISSTRTDDAAARFDAVHESVDLWKASDAGCTQGRTRKHCTAARIRMPMHVSTQMHAYMSTRSAHPRQLRERRAPDGRRRVQRAAACGRRRCARRQASCMGQSEHAWRIADSASVEPRWDGWRSLPWNAMVY